MREKNIFVNFSDLIGGKPTLTEDFTLEGESRVVATTWKDHGIEDTVNLNEALAKSHVDP